MSGMHVASFSTGMSKLIRGKHISNLERRLHTNEVAELLLARAVAQVLAQIFCPQCSRLHCLAQLNLLETLLAAD